MSADSPGTISRDEVAHLARLARLAVTDRELDLFAGQLDVILGAVARVGEVAAPGSDRLRSRRPRTPSRWRTSSARTSAAPASRRSRRSRARPPRRTGASASRRSWGRSSERACERIIQHSTCAKHRPSAARECGERPHPAHGRGARREDPLTGGVRGRGRAGAPRPDRGRRRHRARLPARRGGVGAAVGGPGGRRARRRQPARVAAGRRPAGAQGRLHHDRHAHDLRLEDPRGLASAVRRHGDGAAAGRRDHDPGQDEHGRVRHGLVHRVLGVRAHPQPVGHRPHPGRLRRRLGRVARCLRGPAGDRHGHRRLDPPACGDDRHGGGEADLRRRLPLRPRGLRVVAGPGRPLRAHGARRRAAARGDRRVRPARLHLDRRPGAVGRRGRAGRGVRATSRVCGSAWSASWAARATSRASSAPTAARSSGWRSSAPRSSRSAARTSSTPSPRTT